MLDPHMCDVKKESGGPHRPHDAHDAGSGGAAGRSKCTISPNKILKIHVVGNVSGVNTSFDRICAENYVQCRF